MKVHLTLICFFLAALQDGDIGLITAQSLYEGTEGGNIIVTCSYNFSGRRKLFCKNKCEGKNILIETQKDIAQSDRYIIEYKEGTFPVSYTRLYVTITNLTKSDSGLYRCGLDRTVLGLSYDDVEIRVRDAPMMMTSEHSNPGLVLVVCVPVGLLVLLLVVVLLLLYKGKIKSCCGLNRRGDSEPTEMEVTCDSCQSASIYQSLDQSTRDNDQTYCTLTHTQHT